MRHDIAAHITAFSTERGIVEVGNPYSSFNANGYCGDTPQHVAECRQELCARLGITAGHLLIPHQIHQAHVALVTGTDADAWTPLLEGTDALVTQQPGVCLCISTADCVPLFFYDPEHQAIGMAHAGWRGTVLGIGIHTLHTMAQAFGTQAQHVHCLIGPSIGPEAFEVGDEVYEAFSAARFPMSDISFRQPSSRQPGQEQWHIDLWRANAWQLEQCGILPQHIQCCRVCTYTHHERFFSARRLGINSGRILNGMMIKQKS